LFEIGRPFDRIGADAEEHIAILKALADGNARAAESAVFRHLRNIEKDVLKIVTAS
jgi:DNA-binding GntR family transcriptional regulator